MNSNNCAKKVGERNINNYALTDLRRQIFEDIVFVMKAETHTLNALMRRNSLKKCSVHPKTACLVAFTTKQRVRNFL